MSTRFQLQCLAAILITAATVAPVQAELFVSHGSVWTEPASSGATEWKSLVYRWDSGTPGPQLEGRMFWDLTELTRRAGSPEAELQLHRLTVPESVGLLGWARSVGADAAYCISAADGTANRCSLYRRADAGPAGPQIRWEDDGRSVLTQSVPETETGTGSGLSVGGKLRKSVVDEDGLQIVWNWSAVADGLALLPAGPQRVVLLRGLPSAPRADASVRYEFIDSAGLPVATLEGRTTGDLWSLDRAELLQHAAPRADDGMTIDYATLEQALQPGNAGLFQYSFTSATPLNSVHPAWTTIVDATTPATSGIVYQTDPGDVGTQITIPEIWDMTGLDRTTLNFKSFKSTRDDPSTGTCTQNSCADRDVSAVPPDGTWQAYLKNDQYDATDAFYTRQLFTLNVNDTGANPSIDMPYVSLDQLDRDDWTQICFEQSPGGADRLYKFFQFTGPDPQTAQMSVGESWSSGNWTSCNSTSGLRVTLASVCGAQCWPGCDFIEPFARGMIGGGAGLENSILEDGWVALATGNYLPALLLLQETDLEAGRDFFGGTCTLESQRVHSYDYFWVSPDYGLLAQVSSLTDSVGGMPANDWSSLNNETDFGEFLWGPLPPAQYELTACLDGTRVNWTLPADGSNVGTEPNISNYGYRVSWGSSADPDLLTDPANPNRSPGPGEAGFLAAPAGAEPTSMLISGWPDATIHVSVTTTLDYTDPDFADTRTYESPALYQAFRDPARLDPLAFQVGDTVAPFVSVSGSDLDLSWPAVGGATGYSIRVWDLATGVEIACPAGLDCAPGTTSVTHIGAAAGTDGFGYRVSAVDACGTASPN